MLLHTSCSFRFQIPDPTPFVLMLRPRSGWQQWIAKEEYKITPRVPVNEFTDIYGNLCQRLVAPSGEFSIHTSAEVQIPDEIDREPGAYYVDVQFLPENVIGFLLPSRYCESECFWQMTMEITEGLTPGYDQVAAIENWVRDNISYKPGSSDLHISAVQVNKKGSGVCRDLSHLAIAMCRSMSIPARLVVGYCHKLEPMDMHAWFEAYVGNRWYLFDPSQPYHKHNGYVAIGYGRDAADVAVFNQFGPPVYPDVNKVKVRLIKT
jgi:transglutaminase-like putative cysteine protease